MRTRKIYLTLTLLIAAFSFGQQISSSFVVGGTIDKFYPVTFYDGGWTENTPTELTIGRSSVHIDESWRGSLMASFKYHATNYGNGSNFIKAEISKTGIGTFNSFIAGWDDSSNQNGSRRIVIWLRGGGTTYYCKSNYVVNPVVYDSSAFNEENGPSRSFKTTVEDYVKSAINLTVSGISSNISIVGENLFPANGNAGVGTTSPTEKLTIGGGNIAVQDTRTATTGTFSSGYKFMDYYGESASILVEHNGYFGNTKRTLKFVVNDNESMRINAIGNVGIGTTTPDQKLTVNGTIHAKEIIVDTAITPDYVFQKYYTGKSTLKSDYVMPTLAEIESFTKKNHHLPNVPSAQEAQQKGVSLGEISNVLLQKVEELTLYAIEQQKKLEEQNKTIATLVARLTSLEKK